MNSCKLFLRKISRFVCLSFLALCFCTNLSAQNNTLSTSQSVDTSSISQTEYSPAVAMTSPDYFVTEGDVYSLAFFANGQKVEYVSIIDSSYRLRVANLATIVVKGKKFASLKNDVESIVGKNYPFSGVQFVLKNPSVFKVTVTGEIQETVEKTAWALTRLSDIIKCDTTNYASKRFVTVIDESGKQTVYDLFQAERFGNMNQDPYVRPRDKIVINKIDRRVTINGAIKRPGSYELAAGENLTKLLTYYAEGFTDFADASRIKINRYNTAEKKYKEFYVKESAQTENVALQNYDVVYVYSVIELQPVFFIEGAINSNSEQDEETQTNSIQRVAIRYHDGANYASYLRDNKKIFSIYADLENATIIRKNPSEETENISIDIYSYLIDVKKTCDINIQPFDVLSIPFKQTLPLLPIIE